MTHVIVSRVNMPRELDPFNHVRPAPYKSEQWNRRRVLLLNEFCRPSIKKQTNQNFIFVTLWGDHYPIDTDGALDNEVCMFIRRGFDEKDEKAFDFKAWRNGEKLDKMTMDFAEQIRIKLCDLLWYDDPPFLFTNIDSDDALKYNFVEIIQRHAPKYIDRAPFYLDVVERYLLNVHTGTQGVKKRRNPSPMVSTIEQMIECFPLRYHHSMLGDFIKGTKIKGLYAMQTVGNTNILTQGTGKSVTFNERDFY